MSGFGEAEEEERVLPANPELQLDFGARFGPVLSDCDGSFAMPQNLAQRLKHRPPGKPCMYWVDAGPSCFRGGRSWFEYLPDSWGSPSCKIGPPAKENSS